MTSATRSWTLKLSSIELTSLTIQHGWSTLTQVLDLTRTVHQALDVVKPRARVLAIIPDKTRDDNTDFLFPIAAEFLTRRRVAAFDVLVAQGTHPPMSEAQKLAKIGMTSFAGRLFDHRWDQPEELITLGELSAATVRELTGGLIEQAVPVSVNKLLAPGVYDTIVVFGATVPHEVAGFAGGAKYFFPGVAGPELTHTTHWLGALAGIEKIIGEVETPTRKLIEAAADLISADVVSMNSVVSRNESGELVTYACSEARFAKRFGVRRKSAGRCTSVTRAASIKPWSRCSIRTTTRCGLAAKRVTSWGAIVEDGGELIIYAPHLTKLSETHGALIEKYGYAPLESVRDMLGASPELRENLCIAAHLAHVAYAGRIDDDGRIVPRYRITMATGLDEETCRRVNLGYLDHHALDLESLSSQPDTLLVKDAGRDLYKP